jgi:hypothetical protein
MHGLGSAIWDAPGVNGEHKAGITVAVAVPPVAAFALLVAHEHERVDFGDLPTWLAFAGAAIAVYYTYRVSVREEERDDRYEAERSDTLLRERASQASQIAIWEKNFVSAFGSYPKYGVAIRNTSVLPVYELRVWGYMVAMDVWGAVDEVRPNWSGVLRLLEPREEPQLFAPETPDGEGIDISQDSDVAYPEFVLDFVDSNGVRWHRDRRGRLHEGASEEAAGLFTTANLFGPYTPESD